MASVGEGDCHKDPNFAVVCSFLDKYGASLGLEPISYSDLQTYLEDTTGDVSRILIDIHVRLLRRIGKSIVNSERFEKSIIKFCHNFSEFDAWEVESYGYKHAQLATKLRILKNLLECQFDYNLKFKEKINGESAEEMRLLPIGRDKEGQAYWYFLDHDLNILVYKEEQDDEVADTWKLVCSNRNELADLVSCLQKGSGKEEEDKASTCGSRSSKEGSPDKDVSADKKVAQDLAVEVKEEKVEKQETETDVKGRKIVKGDEEAVTGVKKEEVAHEHFEIVKKETVAQEKVVRLEKGDVVTRELVVDIIRVKRANKKPAEAVKKEKAGREPVAKKGKTTEEQFVDVVNDKKPPHEEMDADSEKVPQEQTVTVVKKENTHVVEPENELSHENSDKPTTSVEAEQEKSISILDSSKERLALEAQTEDQISNDTNIATTAECQDTEKKSDHSGDNSNNSAGQQSAELERTASVHDDEEEPEDDAGSDHEASLSHESIDKCETDCTLPAVKSPGLKALPLSETTSSCEKSSAQELSGTCPEGTNLEVQERDVVVKEHDQGKIGLTSDVSANQTEDANSSSVVDVKQVEVTSQSEMNQAEVTSQSEMNQAEVAPQSEMNQAEVTSQSEMNQAEVAPQSEMNQAEATSQSEMNQAEATSQSEMNQAEATSQSEMNQAEVTSQSEMNQAEATSQSEMNQAEVTSQSEMNQADVMSQNEMNQAEVAPQSEMNQAEATSQSEMNQAEVMSQSEMNQENNKITSEIVEGPSDDTLKERPCSTGENIDTEKITAASSDQLDVQSAEKMSDSSGSVTESCTLASSSVETATESIQAAEEKPASEQKDQQQSDCEIPTVESTNELNAGPVDLCITTKEVLEKSSPLADTADSDTVTVHPGDCDKSASSADLSSPGNLSHKLKKTDNLEQSESSPQPIPEPACNQDQADPRSCQDHSSSINEKSMTEITSEGLTSGAALDSPACSSVNADNQEEKSIKHNESHNSQITQLTHTDSEEAQNTNVSESDVNTPACESVDQPENSVEIKSLKEPEKENTTMNELDNVVEKELTETSCEKSESIENNKTGGCVEPINEDCETIENNKTDGCVEPINEDSETIELSETIENNKTDGCVEPVNEDSEKKQENVAGTKTIKNIKASRRKRKVGKDNKKNTQMVNGHTDNSDLPLNQISEKSVDETANEDCVKCDDNNVENSFSRRPRRGKFNQTGKSAQKNKKSIVRDNTSTKCANSTINDTSVNSENCVTNVASNSTESAFTNELLTNSESSMVNDLSTSNTPSRRKLKRSVPEPASDEPVDSEPNGKRAKQATRTQKTRAGRNAAARGRSARMATRDSESDDSDTPLSQVRGRGQGLVRGAGGRRTRGQARQQTHPPQESAQDEDGEEGNASKLGKKKKPDSSTEALSEEDATPAKKGRNQAQSTTAATSKNSNKGKGSVGKKPPVQTTPAPVAEDDASGIRRSLRVRQQRARRPPTPSSASETSEETSEDELSSEEEEDHDKDFLDSSFTPEEDSGDEEFKPKGRNFQRQAARTSKEEAEVVVNDDTPCVKCGKYNHPEMILLCDKCDAGYHTACLRPPLMLIPDGDWFCPPCEHAKLVEKLLECLQSFDLTIKKKDRLNKRQERLAFVGISISNILHGDRKVTQSIRYSSQVSQTSSHKGNGSDREAKVEKEESEQQEGSASSSSYESKPEPKRMYRSERLAIRQAQKRSRKEKRRQNRSRQKRSPDVEVLSQRTCRTRAAVSYQFKEFDELINNAIEDDKPFRREKPPGISRGKDMSNILGASDEEDEKIRQRDGENTQPPPVVKKKSKRRLTKLDSDDDPEDDEDETDEFKLSEEDDSDATEVEEEDVEDDGSGSSDSGEWKPKKTWYNSRTSSRRQLKNFVVDDDYNSDENAAKRRSTRNSNRGRIHYSDWDSNEEETEEEASGSDNSSGGSLYGRKKSQKQRASRMKKKVTSSKKHKGDVDSHDSDSSITIRRKNLRRLIKKRRKDESESEDSEKEAKGVKEIQKKKKEKKSDSEESHEDSDDSPRFKKKNVLRSSDEDETEQDVTDLEPVMEASQECSKSECTSKVDTPPAADVVAETKEEPSVKTKPDNTIKIKSDIVVKPKPKTAAKGKKRSDWCEEDKVTVPVTDVAVPGKVRRISTSDKEPESVIDAAAPLLPVSEVSPPASETKPQAVVTESEENEKIQDVGMCLVEQKTTVSEKEDCNREPSPVKEKSTGSGKKKTVPNFLDVNSGEESDEQRPDPPKESVAPSSFIADVANVQTTAAPSQVSSDGAKARVHHVEGPQRHRNFSHPGQHYPPYSVGSYNNSVQGASSYAHRQVTGSPQNLGQVGRETGPPPQNANMLSAGTHNGPPGLIRGFPDPMPHPPSTEAGGAVGSGVRGPHSYTARGPRPNLGHSFPPGIRHSSQSLEPGQNTSKLNPEQRMSHPGFQGIPVGHYPPAAAHMRPGQAQQHRGMQPPPFYMGQQQHARPGMENDSNSKMGSYNPHNYGGRQMPSAHFGQDLSAGAARNPYYGMQTSPPHNMGQHFSRQYPANMGPGPHNMSSPLTSMGQMARNLGPGSDMHSPPNTQTVGSGEGPKERRSSMGSPPNPETIHRQEKLVEIRDIKTECNDDDFSGKKVGKTGKKRTISSKSKKKTSESNPATHDLGQPPQHGPGSAPSHGQMPVPAEGQERVSGPGQLVGNYRANSQPYHMPPYQMPYPHGSNVNPLQMTPGPYMNPRHTPPATAHQRSKTDGHSASLKSGEGKWNRTENMETQCSSLPNKSPAHMSSYHQNFQKSQPNEQTGPSLERRHSLSPGSQASDVTPVDRMKDPTSVDQISMRKQGIVDVKPNIQSLPPTAHQSEISPAGQTGAPTSQDHGIHANAQGHHMPPYSQGGGVNTSEAPRAFYNSSPYYPRGPDPRQPMSQNNTWNTDIQGQRSRYGPPMYPYAMNPTSTGSRMPSIKSEFGSHGHSTSDVAGLPEKGSSTQDPSTKDDPVKMGKMGEQQRPVLQRSTSSEFQMVKMAESGQTHQKHVEQDIKPTIRHTDPEPEGAENLSLSESQRQPVSKSESVSSVSSSATSTSSSVQTKMVPHLSDVPTTASMCKQSSSVEPSSFHHSTSSGMNQPYQVSPVASMAPHSSWPRTNSTVQYSHQHMNQWANMGGPPSHYNMNRSYGGPGMMAHPAYGMDPQSASIRPNPGQADQKPFMHQNYESRFQAPYPGLRPAGPETEYHRAGFSPDYSPSGRYPPQLQNCPRRPDGGSHQTSHHSDVMDQGTELNTVSKPKRAKTQKKPGKDAAAASAAAGPMRGKSSKGRGRGRGGFMIDNLLQARGVEAEEGEDSSEMNDIVSYVTTDEYFKQQTSCDSFKHTTDIGVTEKKL